MLTSGGIGTAVTIEGANLTIASAVRFNGVSASYTIKGMQIVATVPAGATTGPIAISTPGGTATSPSESPLSFRQ